MNVFNFSGKIYHHDTRRITFRIDALGECERADALLINLRDIYNMGSNHGRIELFLTSRIDVRISRLLSL